MKACQIFKTKHSIKIVTLYSTDTGTYKLNRPVFILSVNENRDMIKKTIFQAIETSRQVDFKPSDHSILLKYLGEKSFISFYKSSTSCMVFVDGANVTIEPQFFSPDIRALETIHERVIQISNFTEEQLLDEIMKVL